jgi:hypothetical protein
MLIDYIRDLFWDGIYLLSMFSCLYLLLEEKQHQQDVKKAPKLEITERFSDDVILEGEMYKQGHFVRSWKKRKFVLNPFRLCYHDGTQLKGICFCRTHPYT